MGTCPFHFRYADPTLNPEYARAPAKGYIYAFFHEVMLFPAYFWAWPEMQILISDHRDGELITQVVKRLGFGVVRGSTTRGVPRAPRDDAPGRSRPPLCDPRRPQRTAATCPPRVGVPRQPDRPADRGAGMAFRNPGGQKLGSLRRPTPVWRAAACVIPEAVHVPPDADRETIEACRLEVENECSNARLKLRRGSSNSDLIGPNGAVLPRPPQCLR